MLHDFYVNPCLLRKGPVSSSNVIGIFFWVLYLKLSKVASLETLFFDIKDRFLIDGRTKAQVVMLMLMRFTTFTTSLWSKYIICYTFVLRTVTGLFLQVVNWILCQIWTYKMLSCIQYTLTITPSINFQNLKFIEILVDNKQTIDKILSYISMHLQWV